MEPSKEVVTANGMEKCGPGGVSCASMEKGELLHCSCEIKDICCSCLEDHVRTVRVALHCVVQRDHVGVMGGVFCSRENNLSIFDNVYGHRTKMDGAAMGTELENRNKK